MICISGCYSCSGGADLGWVSKNGQRFEFPHVLPTFPQAVQISKDVQVQVMEGMTDLHTSTRVLTTKVKLDILCSSFASLQGGGIEACHHKKRGATTSLKHLIFILTDFYQPSPSSKLILRKRSWRTRAKKRLKRRRNATPSWSRIANWQLRSITLPWPMLSTPKRIWSSQIVRWVEEFNIWQANPIPQNIWQASPIPKNIWQASPIPQASKPYSSKYLSSKPYSSKYLTSKP